MTEPAAGPEASTAGSTVALVDPDHFELTYYIVDDGVWLTCKRCVRGDFDPAWRVNLGHSPTLSAAIAASREHRCPETTTG